MKLPRREFLHVVRCIGEPSRPPRIGIEIRSIPPRLRPGGAGSRQHVERGKSLLERANRRAPLLMIAEKIMLKLRRRQFRNLTAGAAALCILSVSMFSHGA